MTSPRLTRRDAGAFATLFGWLSWVAALLTVVAIVLGLWASALCYGVGFSMLAWVASDARRRSS